MPETFGTLCSRLIFIWPCASFSVGGAACSSSGFMSSSELIISLVRRSSWLSRFELTFLFLLPSDFWADDWRLRTNCGFYRCNYGWLDDCWNCVMAVSFWLRTFVIF